MTVWLSPWRLLAGLWLLCCAGLPAALAQDLRPVPALSARVIDQTGTLTPPQQAALEAKLAAFEAQAGPQIVVLLVPATQPEDLAAFAFRVADAWKIGRREVGDGLLLVVAKDERRVRIEVARALEGAVPDLAARQITDQAIKPAFRAGDYAGGLNQAIDRLIARIQGEHLPAPAPRGVGSGGASEVPPWLWAALVAVPIAISIARALFGPLMGALLMGGLFGTAGAWLVSLGVGLGVGLAAGLATLLGVGNLLQILLSSGGRGGGGGGGGGGFSSGGGGSFGGGGASGDW